MANRPRTSSESAPSLSLPTPSIPPIPPRKWLLIAARNFGDALILRRFARALRNGLPNDSLHILTRPSFQQLFAEIPGVHTVWTAEFPVGTRKNFNPVTAARLVQTCFRLRREHFDLTVNSFGDLRENVIGWLTGPRSNAAPAWPSGHPFLHMVRTTGARWFSDQNIPIPNNTFSVYSALRSLAEQLGCPANAAATIDSPAPARRPPANTPHIGIHPFATQDCRLWPWQHWIDLVRRCLSAGWRVTAFGAPPERPILNQHLAPLSTSPLFQIQTDSLDRFFRSLATIDFLVSLDSFSAHAALDVGIPSLVINGGNDQRLWLPPGSDAAVNGGRCPRFPCYCRPTCGDGEVPLFTCIREISPDQVWTRLQARLTR